MPVEECSTDMLRQDVCALVLRDAPMINTIEITILQAATFFNVSIAVIAFLK